VATIRINRGKWQAIIRGTGYPQLPKSFELKKDAECWGREQEIESGYWVDRSEDQRTTLRSQPPLTDRFQTLTPQVFAW
jgi:hypothetical protein